MFKFNLESITQSISEGTQSLVQQFNDPKTKLSIKAKTRFLQEAIGNERDISKLPPQYVVLEKKCDSIEKVLKRILIVTKTYEIEGYDYPPNISESLSSWWQTKEWFNISELTKNVIPKHGNVEKAGTEASKTLTDKEVSHEGPPSFASAIARAGKDSQLIFESIETKDEDEKEDIDELVKIFKIWSDCFYEISDSKTEMDQMMIKEFNVKLEDYLQKNFQKIHTLRAKVEESRLNFDTMRYEVAQTSKQTDSKELGNEDETKPSSMDANKTNTEEKEAANDKVETKEKTETNATIADETKETKDTKDSEDLKEDSKTSTDGQLLEQLEDEFVSNTTEAVEVMTEVSENSELLSLIKLFQTFQLSYHQHCVKSLEQSLKDLNAIDN
ncbi:uncharacterized protein GVI51_L08437 [Nakaseomyces glabratus]|uniref:Uncharacterized protein n=2 Tax=Candida glabrata TaxID=5478 RepID=Q6FKU8_CANGA|nr:uncharacterized protein CAGL0L08492g [Nakaseomyces glabratus]KAH7581640.1 Bin/amphiphysin/Rvs domain for vesicular trafficking [Nakaseomyces glabratus]KAH7595202.1 Bin/amphiphysin/Rvs domain for vesicular trafficking [Nakaseomyces glabratus]KAH7595631.1 Bin/amphiphysin/Rvs domain for vesicular trafficking [Nakaseomyces glabratus]KAH7602063.1 Bin/amphiphysin/Rvs domain for vesicular trafficking [Nakaseomyces glabratus]KAH7611286.1 Bin/amphiphysin/Rvs domain for vesicular trafficking [Nakaseo|eukprot:XP_449146.1 uncharacterized protein CAGL0L08492g [[Candida] glabrata]